MKNLIFCLVTYFCFAQSEARELVDLRPVSVDIAKLADLGRDVWPGVRKTPGANIDQIYMLVLRFASGEDLVEVSKRYDAHLSFDAHLCDSHDTRSSPLFVVKSSPFNTGGVASAPKDAEGWLVHEVFLPVSGDELARLWGQVSIPGRPAFYNIGESSANVCLQLRAGVMWLGIIGKSNVIMFSRTELDAAWDRMREKLKY